MENEILIYVYIILGALAGLAVIGRFIDFVRSKTSQITDHPTSLPPNFVDKMSINKHNLAKGLKTANLFTTTGILGHIIKEIQKSNINKRR